MANIRSTLKEKLSLVTSHGHKEITNGARKQHDNLVVDLTRQLHEYFDPFLDGPARNFKSGMEIEKNVIVGILSSDAVGEERFKTFINERVIALEQSKISIFAQIKRQNISTGLAKEKKKQKMWISSKKTGKHLGSLLAR